MNRAPFSGPACGAGLSACHGFTLIEVLATLMLLAIVLPTIMRGITLAQQAADSSRHRTEAAGLAQMELDQIVAAQSWQTGDQSGDFSPDWPNYTWKSTVVPWPGDTTGAGIDEIDLTVNWNWTGKQESVVLSTLAYPRSQSTSTQ
ncbi:MAG TPA: type II secretion system protein [Tepidisphaeraceae bacterium]|nr:type II secretion system protein [Tepidisphaeraceae bacterium]